MNKINDVSEFELTKWACEIMASGKLINEAPSDELREFHYHTVQLFKSQNLGIGSYGTVCRALCDDLPCAAKLLHPILFQPSNLANNVSMQRFVRECQFMGAIKHPHVVQYLGTYQDPESGQPILLMELMDESLTNFLQNQKEPLPYHLQVNLCHDVALALSYLHLNGIIHRDLSSNNVLLIAGSKAKVTDFGMSKLVDVNPHMTPLTQCPGTAVYMAPEALRVPPMYSPKLDCFSFGVLCIQIATLQFPDPSPAVRVIEDERSPVGRIQIPVPEIERRKSHIDLIDSTHPLLPTAADCLSYSEEDRPTTHELCCRLAALRKATNKSEGSVHQMPSSADSVESEVKQLREKEVGYLRQIRELQSQSEQQSQQLQDLQLLLQAKDQRLQTQARQLQERAGQHGAKDLTKEGEVAQCGVKDTTVDTLHRQLVTQRQNNEKQLDGLQKKLQDVKNLVREKDATIAMLESEVVALRNEMEAGVKLEEIQKRLEQRERQVQEQERTLEAMNRQLRATEELSSTLQQNLSRRDEMIASLRDSHTTQQKELQELKQHTRTPGTPPPVVKLLPGALRLTWTSLQESQHRMMRGASAIKEHKVYFRPGDSSVVTEFNLDEEKWSTLPQCPQELFALVVVGNLVTAVGGQREGVPTNMLQSLVEKDGEVQWSQYFPSMPTKRMLPAVAATPYCLVAAAGRTGVGVGTKLTTVEVLDMKSLQWSTVNSLPQPVSSMSATIWEGDFYLLGGYVEDGRTQSVFVCPVSALHHRALSLKQRLKTRSRSNSDPWRKIAYVPSYRSTCVTFAGKLLAVGGSDSSGNPTSAVHVYHPGSNSWRIISHMTFPHDDCLVAPLPGHRLMVVGGRNTNSVEIASIS